MLGFHRSAAYSFGQSLRIACVSRDLPTRIVDWMANWRRHGRYLLGKDIDQNTFGCLVRRSTLLKIVSLDRAGHISGLVYEWVHVVPEQLQ